MADFDKMTISELREMLLKEHIAYIKARDKANPEDLQADRERMNHIMEAIDKKLRMKKPGQGTGLD